MPNQKHPLQKKTKVRRRIACFFAIATVGILSACGGSPDQKSVVELLDPVSNKFTRYQFNNQCFVLFNNAQKAFVASAGNGYAATAGDAENAEPFFLKPTSLGSYLLFNSSQELLNASAAVNSLTLANAAETAIWTVTAVGDTTEYPSALAIDTEPTPQELDTYRAFAALEKNILASEFTLFSKVSQQRLAADESGDLTLADAADSDTQSFTLMPATGCAEFAEASSNTHGQSYSGTSANGQVWGYADVHGHIAASTYLGKAQSGWPFHPYGVTHALKDCLQDHGPQGSKDAIGTFLGNDFDGHVTSGWPLFSEWPAFNALTHEAVYWRWLERSWKSGLRIMATHLVQNEILCQVQRNASGEPNIGCNEMDGAMDQVGTIYAMQDYIDAQFGGRGQGFMRIVKTSDEARTAIARGQMATILGVEISHLFDCKLNYNPARSSETDNNYDCSTAETGADNEILTQVQRIYNLGVRHIFPNVQFDNAFSGNGIFQGTVLNVGNRLDTGGASAIELAAVDFADPAQLAAALDVANMDMDTPTGEYWTTYDCPSADDPDVDGYLFSPGFDLQAIPPAGCVDVNGDNRPGGPTGCYPNDPERPQCNIRWLTPTGQYMLSKIMEFGINLEIDHLEYEVKSQALDLAAAQDPLYPVVSGHSGQGGISNVQARRIFDSGGYIYPISRDYLDKYDAVKQRYAESGSSRLFAYGYGGDTNGLAVQPSPRAGLQAGKAVTYPFTLFSGETFDSMPEFRAIAPVVFDQSSTNSSTVIGRDWHVDVDGVAHYGLMADYVEVIRREGGEEMLRDLFNSAEVYLQMWERTELAAGEIRENGIIIPNNLLREPPPPE